MIDFIEKIDKDANSLCQIIKDTITIKLTERELLQLIRKIKYLRPDISAELTSDLQDEIDDLKEQLSDVKEELDESISDIDYYKDLLDENDIEYDY